MPIYDMPIYYFHRSASIAWVNGSALWMFGGCGIDENLGKIFKVALGLHGLPCNVVFKKEIKLRTAIIFCDFLLIRVLVRFYLLFV